MSTGKSYTCHNCQRGRGTHCVRCRRVDFDDIRIQRNPHTREELQAATIAHPWGKVTNLPADVEDALRHFLFAVTSLDALQFIAALHLLRRGRRRALAKTIRAFAADVRAHIGKPNSNRATVWFKWKSMVRRLPELLAAVPKWEGHAPGRGHGRGRGHGHGRRGL